MLHVVINYYCHFLKRVFHVREVRINPCVLYPGNINGTGWKNMVKILNA